MPVGAMEAAGGVVLRVAVAVAAREDREDSFQAVTVPMEMPVKMVEQPVALAEEEILFVPMPFSF